MILNMITMTIMTTRVTPGFRAQLPPSHWCPGNPLASFPLFKSRWGKTSSTRLVEKSSTRWGETSSLRLVEISGGGGHGTFLQLAKRCLRKTISNEVDLSHLAVSIILLLKCFSWDFIQQELLHYLPPPNALLPLLIWNLHIACLGNLGNGEDRDRQEEKCGNEAPAALNHSSEMFMVIVDCPAQHLYLDWFSFVIVFQGKTKRTQQGYLLD